MSDDIKDTSFGDLRSHGVFLFSSDVDEDSCAEAIEFILEANLQEDVDYDHLTLIVNSGGGSVTDGFALIDVMQGSRLPVWTVGLGMIGSMALLIFMSGEKGHRILTPNSLILSHQWWSVNFGKEHELISSRKHNDIISAMIMRHYKKHSKLKNDKEIRKILLPESDVWLNGEEAKKYGLCDEIRLI